MGLAICATAAYADLEKLDLQVPDMVARPNDPIEIVAKLEKAGSQGVNIEGASIEFRLDGKPIGTAVTDDRGRATVKTTAPDLGDHIVKVLYEGNGVNLRAEFRALLAVRKESDPLLAVGIDWTLSITDNLNTSHGGSDCPPVKNAPEVMERLGKTRTIVYVTGRARQLRKRTISWLYRNGFPRGPIFFLDPRDYPTYDIPAHKKSVLTQLKKSFSGLMAGIGTGPDDLEAYRGAGLGVVLVGRESIAGAECVKEWLAVEQALNRLSTGATPRKP